MKVGINAHALGLGIGGIETYVRNIVQGIGSLDPCGDYTLFLNAPLPVDAIPGAEHMRRVVVRPEHVVVRNLITLPLAIARERVDLVHVQMAAPPLCPAPIVVSLHDLVHERYPQFFTRDAALQFRALVPLTVRRAAAVLTISEFSKQDIVRRYCVPPDKVTVTYCAADPAFRPIHDEARLTAIRTSYGTGDRYILCVGNLEPRKNLKTLIAAYVKLRQAGAIRHKLVLVGRKAWYYDGIFAAARDSGYGDDLVFTDYVPHEDLVGLYNAADVFVYPSIFEGFGIPPLEAMACGTPVVTSNTSSLPEVVGDAGVMVDPLDTEALASAIATILSDDALRSRLSARGRERSALFSWEAAARATLDVYRRAARVARS